MQRRAFLKSSAGAAAALVCMPVLISTEGCTDSAARILNTVLQSAESVLAVIEPNAPWLASYKAAVTALQQAEAQWTAGGKVQVVIDALNTLAAVTAVIPITMPYSPLIDVLVAGIEAVLAALPQPAASQALAPNVHGGRAILASPHLFQSRVAAYKAQWNAVCKTNPALQAATLH